MFSFYCKYEITDLKIDKKKENKIDFKKKMKKKIYYPSWDLNPDPEIAMPALFQYLSNGV